MPIYPPKLFHSDDLGDALAIAEAVRFANVFFQQAEVPTVVFLPFITAQEDSGPYLYAHLLRSNPLFAEARQGPVTARVVFNAADGYLSPSVYDEKKASGKVVPTWNYVASQFLVQIEIIPDDELEPLLARQVAAFEGDVGSDWELSDAPDDYVAGLKKMIAGLRCRIIEAHAHKKLSQNRTAELGNVEAWFERQSTDRRRLADWFERVG